MKKEVQLCLRVMSNLRGKPSSSAGSDRLNARVRFRSALFSKGHAGHFSPEDSSGAPSVSIPALYAMKNMITQVNVRSHQPTSAPTSENPDYNLPIQVLDSLLVTPIKAH